MRLNYWSLPFSLCLFLSTFPVQAIAKVEQLPKSCIPSQIMSQKVVKAIPLIIVSYKSSNYHFLVIEGVQKNDQLRAVIRRQNTGNRSCYLSYVDVGEGGTLSYGVPIPVAKAIAVVGYKNAIRQRGGLKSYQAWYSRQNFKSVTPEDAFALKQLGVKLEPNTKVLPWSKVVEKELLIGGQNVQR